MIWMIWNEEIDKGQLFVGYMHIDETAIISELSLTLL